MKKWIVGVAGGIGLMVLTAASPSNAIYGVLFPSQVTFHNGNETIRFDEAGGNEIINVNNKSYIPLRAFAEAMGATVEYAPPNEQTDLHQIDIYQGVAPSQWTLESTDQVYPDKLICRPNNHFFVVPYKIYNSDNSYDKYNFLFKVHNFMPDDITINPLELTFEVLDLNFNVIYSRPLPSLSGVIPGEFGYSATASWDHTGLDGKEVPSGKYYIKIKRPAEITYKVLGSDEEKKESISKSGYCNLDMFQIDI